MGCETTKLWTFYVLSLQKTDRKLLSVSHNQIALLCLSETCRGKKKKKSFIFIFAVPNIQPQCKHSLALLFGFIELTFSQEYTKQKRKKEKQDHPCLFLSAVSHSGMCPLRVLYCPFSFLSSLVQCKSWRPVADGSRLLTHTVKQIARRKKKKNK